MSDFNVGDKVQVNYHTNKQYIGKNGTIVYVGSSMLSNPMPVNEEYEPEQKYRYIVKLDDGTMLENLQSIQIRKT